MCASTDPTQITTTAVLEGDEWVINGRKWMITNASRADFIIFMVVTEPDEHVYQRCSMIIVEKGTPGMDIFRDIPTMHHPHSEFGAIGNHAEIILDNVRVPRENLIGERGGGFILSQVRLGPGRIHHATRWLGEAERAFDMLCERTSPAPLFGKGYAKHQMIQEYIADSRMELEMAKLLTLQGGLENGQAGAPRRPLRYRHGEGEQREGTVQRDRPRLQVHGSLGYSCDMPLELMYRSARMAPLVDGANEVHKVTIAREEAEALRGRGGMAQSSTYRRAGRAALKRFAHLLEVRG